MPADAAYTQHYQVLLMVLRQAELMHNILVWIVGFLIGTGAR